MFRFFFIFIIPLLLLSNELPSYFKEFNNNHGYIIIDKKHFYLQTLNQNNNICELNGDLSNKKIDVSNDNKKHCFINYKIYKNYIKINDINCSTINCGISSYFDGNYYKTPLNCRTVNFEYKMNLYQKYINNNNYLDAYKSIKNFKYCNYNLLLKTEISNKIAELEYLLNDNKKCIKTLKYLKRDIELKNKNKSLKDQNNYDLMPSLEENYIQLLNISESILKKCNK